MADDMPSRPVARVLERLEGVARQGSDYVALCPTHPDEKPSLRIRQGDDGRALFHDFGGCPTEGIVAAIGLTMSDLFPDDGETKNARPIGTQMFPIRDASGVLVAEHARIDFDDGSKTYSWRRNGRPGLHGLPVTALPLYGMPQITTTEPGSTVLLVEGEKATDALTRNGVVAFGTITGASTIPSDAVLEQLRGFDVVLWADHDDAGRAHMARIAARLAELGIPRRALIWDAAPAKGDAADFFHTGGTVAALGELILAATPVLGSRFAEIGNPANREIHKASGFQLTPLADLLAEPEPDTPWLVERLLPAGGLSLLAAKPKVGKSTLVRNLALAVATGTPFLGRVVTPGLVIYLALEEKRHEVALHFSSMGATAERILSHFGAAPEDALAALADIVHKHRPVLAIIDPLFRLIRVRDGNDYAELTRRLEPLNELARVSDCHIDCVHHLGKAERAGGDAILGSTAILGAVDTALLMKRRDDRRTLYSIQRYGDDLAETVIVLDRETGIVAGAGELATVQVAEVADTILATIGDGTYTETVIKTEVGGNQTLVAKALRSLVAAGQLTRTGEGKKGSPFEYRKASQPTFNGAGLVGVDW